MAYAFVFNSRKAKRDYHLGDLAETLCKLQNSTAFRGIDTIQFVPPKDRKLCSNCHHISLSAPVTPISTRQPSKPRTDHFLLSWEWKQVRYEVLKSSRGVCLLCGRGRAEGAILQVDHIKPRRTHPHLALDINNLQVLCSACNQGKGSRDATDWR